jgi:hypothetical protein
MATPQVILNVRYDDDPTVYPLLYPPDSQGQDLNRKVNQLFESKYPDGEFEIFVDLSSGSLTQRVRIDKGGIANCLQPTEDAGTRFVNLDCFLKKVAAPVQSTSPPTVATGRKQTGADQGLWDGWTKVLFKVCLQNLKIYTTGEKEGTLLPVGDQPNDGVIKVIVKMRNLALGFHQEYRRTSGGEPHPKEKNVCGNGGFGEISETFWKEKITRLCQNSKSWKPEKKKDAVSIAAAAAAAAARRLRYCHRARQSLQTPRQQQQQQPQL